MAASRKTETPQTVRSRLAALERGFSTRWTILIFVGAAVCMVGPVIFGTAIWLRQFRGEGSAPTGDEVAWWREVANAAAWFLPVLFIIEWITRGKLFEDTVEAAEDMYNPHAAGRAVSGAFLAEMCLWGPRMVISGIKRLANQGSHRRADRALAAKMVHALHVRGQGMPTLSLYPLANENDRAFAAALAYLMFYEVIGIYKNGDRAWIASEAAKTMKLGA